MSAFEVIERKDSDVKGKFEIIAIDFLEPRYVKLVTTVKLEKGEQVDISNRKAMLDGKEIGSIQSQKDSSQIKVNTEYDVKYTGGYSLDGKTVYLDEHFPVFLNIKGKTIDSRKSIGLHHELPEKWLSDDAYEYPYAHEIATGIERKYVEHMGVTWKDYCDVVDRNLRHVYSNKLGKSPPSLDLAPYFYCRDREALKEIRESSK